MEAEHPGEVAARWKNSGREDGTLTKDSRSAASQGEDEIAALNEIGVDYAGFVLYEKSKR